MYQKSTPRVTAKPLKSTFALHITEVVGGKAIHTMRNKF